VKTKFKHIKLGQQFWGDGQPHLKRYQWERTKLEETEAYNLETGKLTTSKTNAINDAKTRTYFGDDEIVETFEEMPTLNRGSFGRMGRVDVKGRKGVLYQPDKTEKCSNCDADNQRIMWKYKRFYDEDGNPVKLCRGCKPHSSYYTVHSAGTFSGGKRS
jgi:hypothetical protein